MKAAFTILLTTLWVISLAQNENKLNSGGIVADEVFIPEEIQSFPAREVAYTSAISGCYGTHDKKVYWGI